ncbi:Lactoylglutathione lyase [Candidatus Terasakiella magnetica]|nr:Lactoylglutathione lyase [Candidatus Terasakiella magnetica]
MRLDHVNIVVSDMERSIVFYGAVLGLTPIMDRVLSGPWFEAVTGIAAARARCVILDAEGGACRIELLRFENGDHSPLAAASLPATLGLRHLAVRVDDLDARLKALARLSEQTVRVVEVPTDIVRGGKRMCYIRDPDGAMVELCQYGAENPEFR